MSRKLYLSAPLPFVGQKRMFARQYIQVLRDYPDNAVYVDLFGGSGLLSHITKRVKPQATVVYNDFDNYRQRLANIPRTNLLLADLRRLVSETPRHNPVPRAVRENIFQRLGKEEKEWGYVDYITLSSSLKRSLRNLFKLTKSLQNPLRSRPSVLVTQKEGFPVHLFIHL